MAREKSLKFQSLKGTVVTVCNWRDECIYGRSRAGRRMKPYKEREKREKDKFNDINKAQGVDIHGGAVVHVPSLSLSLSLFLSLTPSIVHT